MDFRGAAAELLLNIMLDLRFDERRSESGAKLARRKKEARRGGGSASFSSVMRKFFAWSNKGSR